MTQRNADATADVVLGKNWAVELYDCDENVINDVTSLEIATVEAARRSGATVVGAHFHRFEPQGASGVVVVSESHFAVHTWPEHRYAAVDVFTCGGSIDFDECLRALKESFGAGEAVVVVDIGRGLLGKTGSARAESVPARCGAIVSSWKEKFVASGAWGILTSVDVHECVPAAIRDAKLVAEYAVELSDRIGVKRYGEPIVVRFGEDERVAGLSLVQLIETSLISGHFADATDSAYVDVFSCAYYDPDDVVAFTKEFFGGNRVAFTIALRR